MRKDLRCKNNMSVSFSVSNTVFSEVVQKDVMVSSSSLQPFPLPIHRYTNFFLLWVARSFQTRAYGYYEQRKRLKGSFLIILSL